MRLELLSSHTRAGGNLKKRINTGLILNCCIFIYGWNIPLKWKLISYVGGLSDVSVCPETFQVIQTKLWPSCRTPPPGRWAPNLVAVSASARRWTAPKGHTGTTSLSRAPRPTMPCWCWIPAPGRTLGTQWSSSMWTWTWPRRDAPTWMAFTWVSQRAWATPSSRCKWVDICQACMSV